MSNLNREWNRRRWILALLFLVLMTVSMMGPTQAVSGVATASIAVMEVFNEMIGGDTPSSPGRPTAYAQNSSQWFDELLTPDFRELVGDRPAAPRAGPLESAPLENVIASTSSGASSGTTSQPQSGGGFGYGVPGWSASRGGAGSASGLGILDEGGIPIDSLASADEALAQEMAALDIESSAPMSALDLGIAEEPGGGGLGGPGTGSGGPGSGADEPGSASEGGNLPGLSDGPTLQLTPPGSSSPDQVPSSMPYADGTVPPAVINDLFNELNVPNPDSVGNALNATEYVGGFDLTQVPEPSTLILLTLGAAALRCRSRQGNISPRA